MSALDDRTMNIWSSHEFLRIVLVSDSLVIELILDDWSDHNLNTKNYSKYGSEREKAWGNQKCLGKFTVFLCEKTNAITYVIVITNPNLSSIGLR